MDEHRMGFKPIGSRVWAKAGERPLVGVHPRYEWLYVYGCVRPETGETSFWLTETVNSETFSAMLAAFARERGREIDLVIEGAGWPGSERVEVPASISLVQLPPYSPERQPAEHLWPLIDEVVANYVARDLAELSERVSARGVLLSDDKERIRSLTLFNWWAGATLYNSSA